jgi:hypothetical protein
MYNPIDINKFSGLNCNTDPTLIADYEGSDIVNFRMEKIGKLVSRNGNLPAVIGLDGEPDVVTKNNLFLVGNEGVIGIGELILESIWTDFDTDRFMVYFVRGEEVTAEGSQNKAAFFFAPLTGTNRNVIVQMDSYLNGSEVYDEVQEIQPLGIVGTRELAASEQVKVESDAHLFIDEFVRMNEYRHQLVVSDRTNGDMRITDSFDRVESPTHLLSLQENCLYDFDVDVIQFDYQLLSDQKNEEVENGMALYRYILPKKTTQVTDDKFVQTIGDSAWIGNDFARARENVKAFFDSSANAADPLPGSMFYFALLNPNPQDDSSFYNLYSAWNTDESYVFTNQNTAVEFPDVLGTLELNKDEYLDTDGNKQEELAADVYIWDELKLGYKPSSGTTDGEGFLRDIDRFWNKLTPGIPRITKLNKKVGHGREVPLGVWRYRFVWDFGNGEYSAPTTEVLVQDVLYSALPDSVINADNNSVYSRPYVFDSSEALNADVSVNTTSYSTPAKYYPEIWDNAGVTLTTGTNFLTSTGRLLWSVKDALYDTSHRFGGQETTYTLLEAETNAATNDEARRVEGDFGTSCTVFFSKSDLPLVGFASQYCDVSVTNSGNGITKIVVPIFKSNGNQQSYNSIFDDEGRFRAYAGEADAFGVSLTFPGKSQFWMGLEWSSGGSYWSYVTSTSDDFTLNYSFAQKDVYLNFIHKQPNDEYFYDDMSNLWVEADGDDMNNKPDVGYDSPTSADSRSKQRTNTVLRAIKSENERLDYVKADVPTEARVRLVLNGLAEINLISNGDDYGLCAAKENAGATIYDSDLDYPTKRFYRNFPRRMQYTSGGNWRWLVPVFTDGTDIKTTAAPVASNLEVTIYGEAQRLIALEQLSSYFPASLLFDAPRVRIHIERTAIPDNAKRLLIFRTVSSNRNEFDPTNFGLVDTVEILRAEGGEVINNTLDAGGFATAGDAIFKAEEIISTETDYVRGFSYFDKIKDQNLDYNVKPEDFEGKRDPIKSAFNVALNERMYFANYLETIAPPAPRGKIENYEMPP